MAELLYTFDGCHGDLYRSERPLFLSLIEQTVNCANDDAPSYHVRYARKKLHVALEADMLVYNVGSH